MLPAYKHTTSQDRGIDWKAPTKELSVGQAVNRSRGMPNKIAFVGQVSKSAFNFNISPAVRHGGESNTSDSGDEDRQNWDDGNDPHSFRLSRKEREGVRECGVEEAEKEWKEERRRKREGGSCPRFIGRSAAYQEPVHKTMILSIWTVLSRLTFVGPCWPAVL